MFRSILVPMDGSRLSEAALRHALELACSLGAQVTVITVVEPLRSFVCDPAKLARDGRAHDRIAKQAAEVTVIRARASAAGFGVACDAIQLDHDEPYRAIIDTAVDRKCDLIVMASHGRRGLLALVLGSETNKVLTHSTIPVLVVR